VSFEVEWEIYVPVSPWAEIFSDIVIAVLKVGVFGLMYKCCNRLELREAVPGLPQCRVGTLVKKIS